MFGCADPNQCSTLQPYNDQGIQYVEPNRRRDKQIHRRDVRRGIAQKCAPALARRTTSPDHVFGDARLRNFKSELEHLAMDARRAPKGIFEAHSPYERTQFRVNLRAPSATRLPTPVATRARPLPAKQRLGTDDREDIEDRREPSVKLDEKPATCVCQRRSASHFPSQNDQLSPERRVLGLQLAPRLETKRANRKDSSAIMPSG